MSVIGDEASMPVRRARTAPGDGKRFAASLATGLPAAGHRRSTPLNAAERR